MLKEFLVLVLQYWYEGDEAGDLQVDFSIVWDENFLIDKPTFMKGIPHSSSFRRLLVIINLGDN